MKIFKYCVGVLVISGLTFTGSQASNNGGLALGLLGAIISSSQANNQPRQAQQPRQSQRRTSSKPKKRVSNIPPNCSSERWTTQTISNKPIATNFQGLIVSYDDMGELIVKTSIKNPIPSMFKDGDKIQLTTKFNKGNRITSSTLDEKSNSLIISGIDAMYVIEKLKSSSYVKTDFVNNEYCSQLKGSSKAIKTVASSATFWKNNRPDHINEARVARATQEHATHSKSVASNQKEFGEKIAGIRPKSDLDAADGNVNVTKIQYYVPGSEEIGEMWVNWHINDEKGPMMRLHFMDPTHQYESEAHKIDISLQPIESVCNTDINVDSDKNTSPSCKIVKDLLRADKWGKIAKAKDLKRRYSKRVSFIQGEEQSKKSLAINFQVYENGAMTAQVEEMNHGFPKQFNFTLANALELSRYVENTREKAHKKWMNKTRSKEDLDALFN